MTPRFLIAVLLMSAMTMLAAQETGPRFEVASVKRALPGTTGGRVQFPPGGRFVGDNIPIDFLIQQVYGVRDFQIIAGPESKAIIADRRGNRYQIDARGDASASQDQVKAMVKTLLADRFALKLHKETRELPVYAMIPAKEGVRGARASNGKVGGIALMAPGWIRGEGTTTAFLAVALSRFVDRPVVDRMNLEQVLEFDLMWTPTATSGELAECPARLREMAEQLKLGQVSCPALFTAVEEQIGIRLEPQRAPMDVLVIDSVERPTEN